jgi:hypothetical protein
MNWAVTDAVARPCCYHDGFEHTAADHRCTTIEMTEGALEFLLSTVDTIMV